ncbi:3-dehydroquinate synthase [Hugenholtzia roseola]|uniref:3-dehydroquinate synthase n=1 Tax=Hugenholtzia roseola TaxID=1002 RepID=UPI000685A26A|nr:3-dehydroquinate synthase [Hugenholtzia roseola]
MMQSQIIFVENWEKIFSDFFQKYSSVSVLVDENTKVACLPILEPALSKNLARSSKRLQLIEIPSGEQHKNLDSCIKIWEKLTSFGVDRKGVLLNLGGGVVGDMGGFAAATYKRGIAFWQIPTTLLAQVDASVGGKLGIDFQDFKNQIGIFGQAAQICIDPIFLETLPERELRAGWAEVIKHTLIADKAAFFDIFTQKFDKKHWKTYIKAAVALKSQIVAQDPLEKGLRKILNYGHTIGHAIESFYLKTQTPLLHGEAIFWGMWAENFAAYHKKMLSEADLETINRTILSHFYPTIFVKKEDISAIARYALQDKKNEDAQILGVLLSEIGKAHYDQALSLSEIEYALEKTIDFVQHYKN